MSYLKRLKKRRLPLPEFYPNICDNLKFNFFTYNANKLNIKIEFFLFSLLIVINHSMSIITRTAFLPIEEKILLNVDLDRHIEKFGGIRPYFAPGEIWPTDYKGCPMPFFCQFKDPRKKNTNNMIRVFISLKNKVPLIPNEIYYSITKINPIERPSTENIDSPYEPFMDHFIFPCYKIINWVEKKESYDLLSDIISEDDPTLNRIVKVGGIPYDPQMDDDNIKNNLLQLVECKISPYMWGDDGVFYVHEDLTGSWTCG